MSEGTAKNRFFKDRYAVSMASGRSGGMSVVYRGIDLDSPGTSVAVKVFRQTLDPKESTLLAEAFKRETAALKELQHPNIVRLIDFGIDSATHETFLVLEWIERSLLDHLAASRPTSWPVFYDQVGRPLVEGLAFGACLGRCLQRSALDDLQGRRCGRP
ncbi:MAG: protein kinase [Phycisphaerales bacterium]|nr:protein kinase [Phycisphaerales bacterium]